MSDELTPQELEALKNLPRERMPSAGLEDRVVGAMRERGVLSTKKTARVIRLTHGRVGGLIAATVVLIVGAYSIGLQRGDRSGLIESVQPPSEVSTMMAQEETGPGLKAPETRDEIAATPAQEVAPQTTRGGENVAEFSQLGAVDDAERKLDWKLETTEGDAQPEAPAAMKKESVQQRIEPAPSTAIAEDMATRADKDAGKMKSGDEVARPPVKALYRGNDLRASLDSSPARSVSNAPRTFMLGRTPLTIEAPDSVRVVEDASGRVLLIYTSDGVIRIRLAD